MAESSLHPRPEFASFLQSDANGFQDNVTYYEKQRALRFQKATILQQKRENAYIPGYRRRPATVPAATTLAERAEAISNYNYNRPKSATAQRVSINPVPVEIEPMPQPILESKHNAGPTLTTNIKRDIKPSSGIIKPTVIHKERNIKSAVAHKEADGSPADCMIQRPVTVPGDVMREDTQPGTFKDISLNGKLQEPSSVFTKSEKNSVSAAPIAMTEEDTYNLYKAYQWGTSTQRSYNDANWEEKMDRRLKERPTAGFRNLPDPITYRLNYKRYNSEPSSWQSIGINWDYVQPRRGDTYNKGPQSVTFNTTYPSMQQIPGYAGYSSALALPDFDHAECEPSPITRSTKPRFTDISRKANIPGYSGCVHWSNSSRAHSNMPFPQPTTSARIHREIPLENQVSPFRRDGVLSRMVTTVPPKNPFRRIQY